MSALDRELRRELGRAVRKARKTAEAGARAALGALMVGEAEADASLSDSNRDLRRRLRAHGRQLGDARAASGQQEVTRLAHEVAYEHWHRMLFARFLAENDLLIEPQSGMALSLEDCRELARERGEDPWALAAGFAAEMLPGIFRPDDPSLEVSLPPERRQSLEKTLDALPPPVFHADDSLGWTYQYWQTDRKDEVNASGVKIGADELPAVTQLFTEPYMVRFLFHNTVGAWRAGRLLAERSDLAETAEDEDELRRAVRLEAKGGYDFDFLRFVREEGEDGNGTPGRWRPAAGSYDSWPTRAADLRVLDPCCGSGHFLVEGLHLLVRLRMEEEGLPVADAIGAVLRDNLHGLEIDPRCAQIAAFSVAFAAWKLAGTVTDLPPLHIACSGFAPRATKDEWIGLAEHTASATGSAPHKTLYRTQDTLSSGALRQTFGTLHGLFADGPTLGSLIDPHEADTSLFSTNFRAVRHLLDAVLRRAETGAERRESAVAAAGMAEAASLLAETYSLVITNVPYLARGRQDFLLRQIGTSRFSAAKGDLATMFVARAFGWMADHGTAAFVVPQNWLFLKTYGLLRRDLLTKRLWRFVARLGPGAFDEISGHVVNVALPIISADKPVNDWMMAGLDVSALRGRPAIFTEEKANLLSRDGILHMMRQNDQVRNPDCIITLEVPESHTLLGKYADSLAGAVTGDSNRFWIQHWEHTGSSPYWARLQSTVGRRIPFGGRSGVVQHSGHQADTGDSPFEPLHSRHNSGSNAWGKNGVCVSAIGDLPATLYGGERFDPNIAVLSPKSTAVLPALWCYCSSEEFAVTVRKIDQALKVTNDSFTKIPFNIDRWEKIAAEEYPNGLPEPYSDDPTQWTFHGHPCGSVVWDEDAKRTAHGPVRTDATVLQVAVARLLGYRWPAEHEPEMRLADEQRAWVERCTDLHEFADEDGIVCLPSVRREASAAERLRALLAAAYGDEWGTTTERRLLRAAAGSGQPADDLDEYLRRDFFKAHCRLFDNRPFIWHIWDGLPNGFHALVNYHRLAGPDGDGRRTLESLIFSYLGDWIERQRVGQRDEAAGADARLAAALELQQQLQAILTGEPPLDLFVRWRPLHRQALGWEPDLDDGVRLNIRPFLRAELRRGLKGAGVLRAKPNIRWGKDRGREPRTLRVKRRGDPPDEIRPRADFPWFWHCPGDGATAERTDFRGGPTFDGNRWNDLHYTLDAKRDARARAERDSRAAASDADDSAGTNEAGEAGEDA